MATHEPLLLCAILRNIEVVGNVQSGKWRARSSYSAQIYVADKETMKSGSSHRQWKSRRLARKLRRFRSDG
ncbi:hypothetical protein GALMADRAFT_770110 [Galerina marginata CBS 339.88]|uniref:Uncharacterized protein n=1 Tax=Galerina marginata (strain CBS 339.88) TaxID=685588 RepID=A0A067SN58_GALM3|nr:hypothetical protein GALMADRAFT_770110 [Galerina marginata CBS 339.88]